MLLYVAPFVGAWIEIPEAPDATSGPAVAPFVGAWIEIQNGDQMCIARYVAPFVGAWIEIYLIAPSKEYLKRRSVRRSVD